MSPFQVTVDIKNQFGKMDTVRGRSTEAADPSPACVPLVGAWTAGRGDRRGTSRAVGKRGSASPSPASHPNLLPDAPGR